MDLNSIIVRFLRKDPAKIIGDLINLNHREETVHLGVPYLMQIMINSSQRPLRKKPLQAKAPMGGVCNQFYVHQWTLVVHLDVGALALKTHFLTSDKLGQ